MSKGSKDKSAKLYPPFKIESCGGACMKSLALNQALKSFTVVGKTGSGKTSSPVAASLWLREMCK